MRAKLRLSQQDMAVKLNIAPMTLSRFERGVQVPRDADVLASLRNVAHSSSGLAEEFLTFQGAFMAAVERRSPYEVTLSNRPDYSADQWEFIACARAAALHFPEEMEALRKLMKKTAPRSIQAVRQAVKTTDFSVPLDDNFYAALEQKVDDAAKQMGFERLQKEGDNQ
jgi:transcriptional regulator with XRE-family HTH domain